MIVILGLWQLLNCLAILLYEYRKKSVSVFFWAVCMVIFSMPHMISIVSNTTDFSDLVLNRASIFVIGFQFFYIITRLIILKNKKFEAIKSESEIKKEIKKDDEREKIEFNRIFKLNILVFFIFAIYFIFRFGSISDLSWGEVYQASISISNFQDRILEYLKSINHILFFAVTGLLISSIYRKKKKTSLFIVFLILFYSFSTRNRITLLPLLVAIITLFIMKNKKINLKQILIFLVLGVIAVYIVYAVWIFRHVGTVTNFFNQYTFSTFNTEVLNAILNGEGEFSLKNIFYYFININNDFPGLGDGATYVRLLLMYLPTKFCFGLKPDDFAITMSSAYTGNIYNTNYSVHPTFFGDLFANFYFYGILFGILWAIIFYCVDKYISKKDNIIRCSLIVIWGTCFVIMARGSVYNSLYIAISSTIILKGIELIKNKKFVFK